MTLLRRYRMAKGLTQSQLAKRVGRSPQSVCEWEAGVSLPKPGVIPLLARVLGLAPLELTKVMSPDDEPAKRHPGA